MGTTNDTKPFAPALIVFGKTAMGRPRAAWFSAGDAAVAKWVARHFGLSMLKTRSKAARTVAESLTEWELKTDGQPTIPFIKHDLFDALLDIQTTLLAKQPDDGTGNAEPSATPEQEVRSLDPKLRASARQLWDGLTINSLVLAREDDPANGWWEAVILAQHDDILTLYFRDYPHQGLIKRQRLSVALLAPPE